MLGTNDIAGQVVLDFEHPPRFGLVIVAVIGAADDEQITRRQLSVAVVVVENHREQPVGGVVLVAGVVLVLDIVGARSEVGIAFGILDIPRFLGLDALYLARDILERDFAVICVIPLSVFRKNLKDSISFLALTLTT